MAETYQGPWVISQLRQKKLNNTWPDYEAVEVPAAPYQSYGYWVTGMTGSNSRPSSVFSNSIERYDFSNDTSNSIDRADMADYRWGHASF